MLEIVSFTVRYRVSLVTDIERRLYIFFIVYHLLKQYTANKDNFEKNAQVMSARFIQIQPEKIYKMQW